MANDKELQKQALELSLAVYRVTNLFPPNEILVQQIRGLGNELIGCLIKDDKERALIKINILLNYFDIAAAQNWTDSKNFIILSQAYQRFQDDLFSVNHFVVKQFSHSKKNLNSKKNPHPLKSKLTKRQEEILDFIKNQDKSKPSDLFKKFFYLSSRTLRRELNHLCQSKLIKKSGDKKGTIYKLI